MSMKPAHEMTPDDILERERQRIHAEFPQTATKPRFRGHNGDMATQRCKDCDLPTSQWPGSGACPGTKPVPPDEYAVVEVFGHQRHIGRICEVERFGTKMMRMDEPIGAETATFERFTTYFLSGASIFRMTPCTLDYVERYHSRPGLPVGRLTAPSHAGYEDVSEDIHVLADITADEDDVSRETEGEANG